MQGIIVEVWFVVRLVEGILRKVEIADTEGDKMKTLIFACKDYKRDSYVEDLNLMSKTFLKMGYEISRRDLFDAYGAWSVSEYGIGWAFPPNSFAEDVAQKLIDGNFLVVAK